jgi:hypothetical protein
MKIIIEVDKEKKIITSVQDENNFTPIELIKLFMAICSGYLAQFQTVENDNGNKIITPKLFMGNK